MRVRTLLALGVVALIAGATVPASAESTVTLDGKKYKGFSVNMAVKDQNNVAPDFLGPLVKQVGPTFGGVACAPPRCYKKSFLFKPAAGVKGDLVVKAKWGTPASDYDLYLYPQKAAEDGFIGYCGGSASSGEVMVVPFNKMKTGKIYTLVINFQQSYQDKLSATLTFPSKWTTKYQQFYDVDNKLVLNGSPVTHQGCAMDGTLP
ncbi:MAG: hypothetical protein QOE45_51 [Frankiaceae bacterium]|jgi:hypothetical protein|nr:hypothetical protein [Frankiaceae bacterium]